jgi:protoporphyrinogen oxidase
LGRAHARSSKTTDHHNARDWFAARYGQALFDALMGRFIAKLWGDDGSGIDASFVNTLTSGAAAVRTRERSGARDFQYPAGGLDEIWQRLAARIRSNGVVNLGSRVDGLLFDRGRVTGLRCGSEERRFDHVISSMPLHAIARAVPGSADMSEAFAGLRTRNILAVHIQARALPQLQHAWVFIDDARLAVGRVSDRRLWFDSGNLSAGETILSMEYWCADSDPLWCAPNDEIARVAAGELEATGLFRDLTIHDAHVTRLVGALPVPTVGYLDRLAVIRRHLDHIGGLTITGRHGLFSYDSTFSTMGSGLAAARSALLSLRGQALPPTYGEPTPHSRMT